MIVEFRIVILEVLVMPYQCRLTHVPFSHLIVLRGIIHLVCDFLFKAWYKLFCIMIHLGLWQPLILHEWGVKAGILRIDVICVDSSSLLSISVKWINLLLQTMAMLKLRVMVLNRRGLTC
jgi:hypothetical protein